MCAGRWLLAVLVAACWLPAGVGSANTPPVRVEFPTVEFDMGGRRWKDVLEWFSRRTGLPFSNVSLPPGTFPFNGPKGVRYTLSQVEDIINKELRRWDMELIRREDSLLLRYRD